MSSTASRLEDVFRQLDYLDDGYEDGFVSHVGLRRIILGNYYYYALYSSSWRN